MYKLLDNKSAVVRFENAYKMYILLSLLIKKRLIIYV